MAPSYELAQPGGIADRTPLSDPSKCDRKGLEWRIEIRNIHEPKRVFKINVVQQPEESQDNVELQTGSHKHVAP